METEAREAADWRTSGVDLRSTPGARPTARADKTATTPIRSLRHGSDLRDEPVPLGTTNVGSTFTYGGTAGAGAELRLGSRWTTGLEYLFEDYAKAKIDMPSFNRTDKFQFMLQVARVTAGYRF